jgi:phenylpropionate dioxygenase-like ring-hydroxylating dioxygenase large terminal subunit
MDARTADRQSNSNRNRATDLEPGRYKLRDAWFPLAHSESVTRRPVKRLVHSESYYLWRDSHGRAHATEYHPVREKEFRHCTSEFTGGNGEYPIAELYGQVWGWYGNPHNSDERLIPDTPYLPRQGGLPAYTRSTTRFDCGGELSIENLLDLSHADYLHSKLTGTDECESDTVNFESTSETVTMTRIQMKKKTPKVMKLAGVHSDYMDFHDVVHVYVRSNLAHSIAHFTPHGEDRSKAILVQLFHPVVPETPYQCRLNATMNVRRAKFLPRYMLSQVTYPVSLEDNYALRPQNRRFIERPERQDLHSRFDGAGVRYRFLLNQLAERQEKGDYSYLPDANITRDMTEVLQIERVN